MHPQVIVVDDEPQIVQIIRDVLEDEAIRTDSCPHGHLAYACIRHKQPQVVILDVQMPGVDGIQLFNLLRGDSATAPIPVIFVTANADRVRQWLPDYHSRGATILPKPFDIDTLVELVQHELAE